MKVKTAELKLDGKPICRGIAIGRPFFFTIIEDHIPCFNIQAHDIEREVSRYVTAVDRSVEDVIRLQKQLKEERILEGAAILDAYLQIMQDPLLTSNVQVEIRNSRKNAEYVFHQTVKSYQKKFQSLTDSFFRERFKDIQDISRRIMGHLLDSVRVTLADIPKNSVVFARELCASDIAEANHSSVCAIVTEGGGATSHAAIVAKAKGIPYVLCDQFSKICPADHTGDVVVDGRIGEIYLSPSKETINKFTELNIQLEGHRNKLEECKALSVETFDGYQMHLSANIDVVGELDLIHTHGGSGVGLFRSEYIFLASEVIPSEEEQFGIYRDMVEKMNGLPIVIRTFDVGGDKPNENFATTGEGNSFLGCRAMRFMLRERAIFKQQLRAILRASAYGDVSIMFPMISALSELIEAKNMVEEVRKELFERGVPFGETLRIGCMIEVPSAAIIADLLAKECDFLSIGTNDLVQYSLAVDRASQTVGCHYSPTDPSLIRLIKLVVTEANHHGIPVTVCGEIASDPRFTPLLLGLGVHELSVSSRYLPIVKNAVRNTSIVAASHLAEEAMALSTAEEIEGLLTERYRQSVPEDCFYNY